MEFFSELDVAMERTAICVVDGKGEVSMRSEIVTDPDAIVTALKPFLPRLRRAGHEAGSLPPWLQPELAKRGLPAICSETRHARAAISARRNKTDTTDALALAHFVRTGWFGPAPIKTESCYRLRLLVTQRRNLKRKVLDLETTIRHSLKAFGIRIKGTGRTDFDAAVREAVEGDALTSELRDAMLAARAMLWMQYCRLHEMLVMFASRLELCRRFMAVPSVGPVTA